MFKKFLQTVSINRLLIYFVILGFLPLIFIVFHYTQKKIEWGNVSKQILNIHYLSAQGLRKQSLNSVVRHTYAETDQFYLENHLESINFLKKEKETLEQLFKNPSFTGNEAAEKRFIFLTSGANRLKFTQGSVNTAEKVQETNICLSHPVEIDAQDLKEILMRIEGGRKGKPQLIISDFKLNKKELANGNEVFELNMKLLKREFSS